METTILKVIDGVKQTSESVLPETNTPIAESPDISQQTQPVLQPSRSQTAKKPDNNSEVKDVSDGVPEYLPDVAIRRDYGYYWLENYKMEEEVYLQYLERNCQAAYSSYKTGKRFIKAGIWLFASGTTLLATGIVFASIWGGYVPSYDYYYDYYYEEHGVRQNEDLYTVGCVLAAVGSATVAASIPLWVIGRYKKKHTHNVYNRECVKDKSPMAVNLQIGGSGVGLALKF